MRQLLLFLLLLLFIINNIVYINCRSLPYNLPVTNKVEAIDEATGKPKAKGKAKLPFEVSARVGDLPMTPFRDDLSRTVGHFPKLPDVPRLQEISRPYAKKDNSWTRKRPEIPPDKFPANPPKPRPDSRPPPLSPSGRWLHSAVLIDGRMYVYGGVGSYSSALLNDMWVYNYIERTWYELQASYIPPFPVEDRHRPELYVRQGPVDMYHPDDAPPEPAMREQPGRGPLIAPAGVNPLSSLDPTFKANKQPPVPVGKYIPPPYRNDRPPGYTAFLELDTQNTNSQYQRFINTLKKTHVNNIPKSMQKNWTEPIGHRRHRERTVLMNLYSKIRKHRKYLRKAKSKSSGIQPANKIKKIKNNDDDNDNNNNDNDEEDIFMEIKSKNKPARQWKSGALSNRLMSPFIAADLWEYDVDMKVWRNIRTPSRDIPSPRWLHSAVHIKGRMVIFGGTSFSDIILGDVWVYDPTTLDWLKANPSGDPILPREGHSAVVGQEVNMWVFGGISYGQVPFNDIWVYDSSANAWFLRPSKGVAPPPRWMHSAVMHKDDIGIERMYVFGGVTRNYIPLDDLWILNTVTMTWDHPVSHSLPPHPRMLHTSAICHDKLFIFAGMANNIPLEDIWVWDMTEKRWHNENPWTAYPFAREGASIVRVTPPNPNFKPQPREPWIPPKPIPPSKENTPEALMPLIHNYTTPRPLNRYRKQYNLNRYLILFGGAGPKPY